MFLRFDSEKAIQAVGVILRSHPRTSASKLRILKLFYIADRESIKETGHPLIGSRVVAMDHGPLHSRVSDLINGADMAEPRLNHLENTDRIVLHEPLRTDVLRRIREAAATAKTLRIDRRQILFDQELVDP